MPEAIFLKMSESESSYDSDSSESEEDSGSSSFEDDASEYSESDSDDGLEKLQASSKGVNLGFKLI